MPNQPTLKNLQRAIQIAEQIDALEKELRAVLSGEESTEEEAAPSAAASAPATPARRGRRPAAGINGKKKAKSARGGKREVSAEARARMAAAQKARRDRERGGK